jgi:predicted nucleic acid-binding protein
LATAWADHAQDDGASGAVLKSVSFAEQVLPFDTAAAERYALVVTQRDGLGLPIDGFDAQIAAICRAQRAALATRNLADFRKTGVEVINPWQAGS